LGEDDGNPTTVLDRLHRIDHVLGVLMHSSTKRWPTKRWPNRRDAARGTVCMSIKKQLEPALAVAKEANAIQRESIAAMQRFITSLELFIERGSVAGIHGGQPRIVCRV
jgi:hypothetical protein